MTPQDYEKVSHLFERLQALPEPERTAALDAATCGDAALRAAVARLLDADRLAGERFLERPAMEVAARLMPVDPSAELPAPGTCVGSYRLGRRIGSGGMADVFEAEDLRLGRRVAVKILPRRLNAPDDDRVARFHREARAASTLNHPNIVSIFDAGTDEAYSYIAMEYVEGKTLRHMIAPGDAPPPDPHAVLEWISQVASALDAAHQAGIVHRDIKPENIMVRPDGFVKVLDFGLAKLYEPSSKSANAPQAAALTRPGNVAGTIQYLSPEQISGKPATPTSDLFSLGVVAYEVATGARPFDGPTDAVIYNAILTHTPGPPSKVRQSIPPEFDALVLRAIEKEPELRFQTAGDLRSACRRMLRDHTVRNSTPSGQQSLPVTPRSGRRPLLWMLAGLAAIPLLARLAVEPEPEPRVTNLTTLVHGGPPVIRMVADGSRLYYAAGKADGTAAMYQVSGGGGEPVPMPQLSGMFPLDVSRDGSKLLLGRLAGDGLHEWPLWVANTVGNPPRPLAGLKAEFARWSPAADRVVYSNGAELRIARADGSASTALPAPKGYVRVPNWSPDGRFIRFAVTNGGVSTTWQVRADGTDLRQVLHDARAHDDFEGAWTPDGRYFLFSLASEGPRRDLWLQRESNGWFGPRQTRRWRFTNGPMNVSNPVFRPDGKRIYFRGELEQGELVRYEPATGTWQRHIGGLAATQLEYSRDGEWVTYMGPPGHSIWRAAADGSQRLQLTGGSLIGSNPRWSPDGSQIAFFGNPPGQPSRIYIVPASGGAVRQVTSGEAGPGGETDASFSADGKSLVYGVQSSDQTAGRQRHALRILDLATGKSEELQGSEGLWSPRWSPDGKHIAALGFPNRLWLYTLDSHLKRQLTEIGAGFPSWSRSGDSLYFESSGTTIWYRVAIGNGKLEPLVNLRGLRMPGFSIGWVGLDPNDMLLSTRDISSVDIYALDWTP